LTGYGMETAVGLLPTMRGVACGKVTCRHEGRAAGSGTWLRASWARVVVSHEVMVTWTGDGVDRVKCSKSSVCSIVFHGMCGFARAEVR